jgi:deoxyribose-phosphate aldolase
MRLLSTAAVLLLALCGTLAASEAETAAKDFWKVFVQGDLAKLQEQYAEEVVLKAGSEFLKKEWGINESGDRDKDKTVARAELMKAYSRMLTKIGKEKWTKLFGAIPDDKITTKVLENKHVVLMVKTGPGDDQLEYELALNKDQTRWQVVAERTDY